MAAAGHSENHEDCPSSENPFHPSSSIPFLRESSFWLYFRRKLPVFSQRFRFFPVFLRIFRPKAPEKALFHWFLQ
jgi:hypothetical protein